jgi:hypothetical protein
MATEPNFKDIAKFILIQFVLIPFIVASVAFTINLMLEAIGVSNDAIFPLLCSLLYIPGFLIGFKLQGIK